MKRRELLAGGAGLVALAALPSCADQSIVRCTRTLPVVSSLIDAHCHIFNGSDLASVRFIKIAIMQNYPRQAIRVLDIEDPDAVDGLLSMFTWILGRTRAPSATDEIKVLDREARPDAKHAATKENDEAVIGAVAEIVQNNGVAVAEGERPEPTRKIRSAVLRAAGISAIGASDAQLEPIEARAIAEKAYRSKFDLGVLLRWFGLFTRYRYSLAEQLADEFRCEGFMPLLLCPALVDYDYWLGQYVDTSPLPEQVAVMGRLARRRTGPVVHGYVGFDPLRQAAFGIGESKGFEPMALVKRAIEEEGFVGVKLYPPMGFRAMGNAAAACQTYPDIEIIRKLKQGGAPAPDTCQPRPADGSAAVGGKLDKALADLYQYCADQGACVLAHANDSNGANVDYGKRADPAFWIDVFTRWPTLRVSLAHFGHFEEASAGAPPGAQGVEASWEWTLGRYVGAHPDAPVFTDVSYLSEIMGKSPTELAAYAQNFRRWLDAFDPECRHLIFGTDWIMLGIESDYVDYAARVYAFFKNDVGLAAAQLDRLFVGNAAAFVGLNQGARTRQRLLDFYAKNGVPASRLRKL